MEFRDSEFAELKWKEMTRHIKQICLTATCRCQQRREQALNLSSLTAFLEAATAQGTRSLGLLIGS